MAQALIEALNLEVRYGGIVAVKGISFAVEENEIVCLIGANGAGKTSTLKALARMIPSRGEIHYGRQRIDALPGHELIGKGLALVPEGRGIFARLTIAENLSAVARPGPWTVARIYDLFPRLAERKKNLGNQLSGGEQQMLAFGRALVLNPKLLLLDEPLEGLAPLIVAELLRAIRRVAREEGLSSIGVEQHPHMVLGVTDDAIVLDRGGIAYRAESAALIADPAPLDAWLGVAANH